MGTEVRAGCPILFVGCPILFSRSVRKRAGVLTLNFTHKAIACHPDKTIACHPERSEGPMHCSCTIRFSCTFLAMPGRVPDPFFAFFAKRVGILTLNFIHKTIACHPEQSEGPMYRACTIRPSCPSPAMLGDSLHEFIGHLDAPQLSY